MGDSKLTMTPGPDPGQSGDGSPAGDRPPPAPGPSRHGAITRRLFTYSNYKSWAERMRSTWEDEDEAEPAAPEAVRTP